MNGGGAQYVHSSVQREIEGMLNRSGIRTKSGVGVFKDVVAQEGKASHLGRYSGGDREPELKQNAAKGRSFWVKRLAH